MTDNTTVWRVDLATAYGDRAERHASAGQKLRPHAECSVTRPDATAELTLAFDVSLQALVEGLAKSVLHAAAGDHAYVREAKWTLFRDGEAVAGGTNPLVCRPRDGGIALDAVAFEDRGSVTVGRFDPDVPHESLLPDGPVPIATDDLLEALRDVGDGALERYRANGSVDSGAGARLRDAVRDIEVALDRVEGGRFTGFDDSLDAYETLLLENPTTADDVHGPLRDEWLERHAREPDVIERLIDERVRSADAETARSWYKSLTMIDDEITERTLDALAADPDQCAVGALLLFLWDDDPQFAPPAIRILAEILGEHDVLDETREGRDDVRAQIEKRVERSEHPDVRLAAVEALAALDDPEAKAVLESALNDSDEDVRAAAERALEADDT